MTKYFNVLLNGGLKLHVRKREKVINKLKKRNQVVLKISVIWYFEI